MAVRLIACALWLGLIGTAQAAKLQDVRIWQEPDQTRVVLEFDAKPRYSLFTLNNPARAVLDIDGGKLAGAVEPEVRGNVREVRFGKKASELRVVLDLHAYSKASDYLMPPNEQFSHRIVVSLPKAADAQPVMQQASVPPAKASSAVALTDKTIVVAIDPGHGGEDPGAIGPSGVQEKEVALQIAQRLAKLINKEPGMKAVLTRKGDYIVPLRKRWMVAQAEQADLFVSIHADAFTNRKVRGSSVYVLSHRGASSQHARLLADRENASDLVGGIELEDKEDDVAAVLIDIAQNAAIEASMDLGTRLLGELAQLNHLHKPGVQRAGFAVLKAPAIPSVLVETAFISNRQEEKRLKSAAYQQKLALSLREGILSYFEAYRPQRVIAQAD